jgi:hypothetical protein
MTEKAAFTPEEWKTLVQSPLNVAMLITVASPSLFGGMKEMFSAAQALVAAGQQAPGTDELANALFSEFRDKQALEAAQPKYDTKEPAALKQAILTQISAAVTLLDQKATADEAGALKKWLYEFGVRQANASKEGGFLGIGAVRVNEAEKAALVELAKTLGVEPPAEAPVPAKE